MADQELKTLLAQGLQALKDGGDVARAATAEIEKDARDPGLRAALQTGNETSKRWARRIERALAEAGTAESTGNPVLETHFEVSRRVRQKAPDDPTRDLGIIAAGQLAPHYWIAAFGTLRTYASALGMRQTEQDLQVSLDEARQADSSTRVRQASYSTRAAKRHQAALGGGSAECRHSRSMTARPEATGSPERPKQARRNVVCP